MYKQKSESLAFFFSSSFVSRTSRARGRFASHSPTFSFNHRTTSRW